MKEVLKKKIRQVYTEKYKMKRHRISIILSALIRRSMTVKNIHRELNLYRKKGPDASYIYTYQPNQSVKVLGKSYSYDESGLYDKYKYGPTRKDGYKKDFLMSSKDIKTVSTATVSKRISFSTAFPLSYRIFSFWFRQQPIRDQNWNSTNDKPRITK